MPETWGTELLPPGEGEEPGDLLEQQINVEIRWVQPASRAAHQTSGFVTGASPVPQPTGPFHASVRGFDFCIHTNLGFFEKMKTSCP